MDDPALIGSLLLRCTFPSPGTVVTVSLSGGPDSTALLALATAHGLAVEAVHVDHGIRPESHADALVAEAVAQRFGAKFRCETVQIDSGPNLEARARAARREVVGAGAMTGHTADDQAETLLLNLLRGAGLAGVAGMRPGHVHPILSLRRHETWALCENLGLTPAQDASNLDPAHRRNRVRHELMPLLDDLAQRDVVPLLVRHADHAREAHDHLDHEAAEIDPTNVAALRAAKPILARVALRRWLRTASGDGLPPDQAAIERVFAVVDGRYVATEISGGSRVARRSGRLRVEPRVAGPDPDFKDHVRE